LLQDTKTSQQDQHYSKTILLFMSQCTHVRRVRSMFQAMICQCKLRPIPAIMHLTCNAAEGVLLCSI